MMGKIGGYTGIGDHGRRAMYPIKQYLTDPKLNCHEFYKECVPIFMTKESIGWLFPLLEAIDLEEDAPEQSKAYAAVIRGAIAISLGHEDTRMQ